MITWEVISLCYRFVIMFGVINTPFNINQIINTTVLPCGGYLYSQQNSFMYYSIGCKYASVHHVINYSKGILITAVSDEVSKIVFDVVCHQQHDIHWLYPAILSLEL